MKVFKRNNKLNKNEDYEIEKRFNTELNEIKEKLNSEKLSEEFKANLNAKLEEELNKTEDSNKGKIIKFPNYSKKLAGICACIIFLFSSCFTFADDIENIVLKIFSNTDKNIKSAIEEGNYKEIQMDYIEDNGVSIKVEYIVVEEDKLYIAFNILGEKGNKIFFNDINIKNQNGSILYTIDAIDNVSKLSFVDVCVEFENSIILYQLTDIQYDLSDIEMLEIEIKDINFVKENANINKKGLWKLNLKL